jgi:hypothetical protein
MQKITVLGKKFTLPLPFRTNSELGISDYKIKIPKNQSCLELVFLKISSAKR